LKIDSISFARVAWYDILFKLTPQVNVRAVPKGARLRHNARFGACAVLLCLSAFLAQAQRPAETQAAPPAQTAPAPLEVRAKATEREIDGTIPADKAVEAVIAPYSAKVRELDVPIGQLAGELKKIGMGAGSLGNFVADALRARAEVKLGRPVLLAITNGGGLRKNEISAGALSSSDIYQLLPFENALVALDLTGEQLIRFLKVVVSHRDAQSGARIIYRTNEKKESELVAVGLGVPGAWKEVDPRATYTIVTIDYLVNRGGDYGVLKEAKNVHPLGVTMRDAVLDYVKAETAAGRPVKALLDGRFSAEKPAAATTKTEDEEPQ
jgi:2',3'-cyclic-nucleotide 2'-phosphodiesterase (5'-nucleotidase family)